MRSYETTFSIDGLLDNKNRQAIIKRFEKVLTKNGAEFDSIVRWGERLLAYEINKRSRGYYVIFYYAAKPDIISTFHHELDLSENILRYMTLHWDGEHPDYIRDEGEKDSSSSSSQQPESISGDSDETEEITSDEELQQEEEKPSDTDSVSSNEELAEEESGQEADNLTGEQSDDSNSEGEEENITESDSEEVKDQEKENE